MEFRLTAELIDTVVYGMENQGEDFLFDLSTCQIVNSGELAEDPEENRYVSLPVWGPAQGFLLMEKFVVHLRNPIYREFLKEALSSGKGVFRKFKDVIKQRSDIERLWYNFKEKEMQRQVTQWYEQTCEGLGLEKLGGEPEITDELLLSDFSIQSAVPEQFSFFTKMDRDAFHDSFPNAEYSFVEEIYQEQRKLSRIDPDCPIFIFFPEGPQKEIAGLIWGEDTVLEDRTINRIRQLYVVPEYRGLGLAKLLLDFYRQEADNRGADEVFIEISGNGLNLGGYLENIGFKPFSKIYSIKSRHS